MNNPKDIATLHAARAGDIEAFNVLFLQYERPLKSYLYRLLTDRRDVEDLFHDTFVKSFDSISQFAGELSQLRSWIFTIATRLSLNHLRRRNRWETSAQDVCRDSLMRDEAEQGRFYGRVQESPLSTYDIREHIDFCFTCIAQTLSIEQQVALLLKDIYNFKVKEIAFIMARRTGQVKHYLHKARRTMTDIYQQRCALINKDGTCYQCTELLGIFNPDRDAQRALMKIEMARSAERQTKEELFRLRTALVRSIDPNHSEGSDLHDLLMQHLKKVNTLT